jgi:hypothetical protein
MPRNVRNSWVDLSVDGRANDIGTGPRSSDGGMVAYFKVRDKGRVVNSVTVDCVACSDGTLYLRVFAPGEGCVFEHKTER